jgi:threonine/homoserine/homoserine lactone efflux protein
MVAVGAAGVPGRGGQSEAILIFTAFLPQFVDPARPMAPLFAVLGALFLLLEMVAIAIYAWMGARMRQWFAQPRGKRLFNRGCAGLLAGAGLGLLLARRS